MSLIKSAFDAALVWQCTRTEFAWLCICLGGLVLLSGLTIRVCTPEAEKIGLRLRGVVRWFRIRKRRKELTKFIVSENLDMDMCRHAMPSLERIVYGDNLAYPLK